MTKTVRIPGDLSVPTRFFGQLTVKDLARLGLPLLVALYLIYTSETGLSTTILWLGTASTVGAAAVLWNPFGQHVDRLAYHAARWYSSNDRIESRDLGEIESRTAVNSDGEALGVVRVDSTNLEMKNEAEQAATLAVYQELYDTITYPVTVHSRQTSLDLDDYKERIEGREISRNRLKQDYLELLSDLSENDFATTTHYIVVRAEKNRVHWVLEELNDKLPEPVLENLPDLVKEQLASVQQESEWAPVRNEVDNRCQDVTEQVNGTELTAERLTGRSFHRFLEQVHSSKPNTGWNWTTQTLDSGYGEYRKTLYITEFPRSLELGWIRQLLRTQGQVDITQVVRPVEPSKASKTLQRLSEKLNAEIDSFLRQGYRGTNKLEALLDDVEWFLDLLADRETQPVEYGVYITAHSSDREDCIQTFQQVCNRLNTMQIEYRQPVFRTDQAYITDNPVYGDRLNQTQLMPSQSAAAGFPFTTIETEQSTGIIYGVDTSDHNPVLLDRFSWSSHSMARMGMVGSGKSYAAKLEILRSYLAYPDLQIIVVDPKKEYKHLINALDGETQTIQPGRRYRFDSRIQSFEVEKRGQLDNVEPLTELVQQIYAETSQDQEKKLVVVDEARILMNDERGRQVLNQFVLEGRDTNTAITLISQNASHFTYCREGRGILDNMPGKVFMRHDRVPESVVDYFDLSQREKQELFELKTGTDTEYSEALLKVSNQLDTRLKITATGTEHAIIETQGGNSS